VVQSRGPLTIVLVCCLSSVPGHARAYLCKTAAGVALAEVGQLVPTHMTRAMVERRREFVFDEEGGQMRYPGASWRFEVLQSGTRENGMVAQRLYRGAAAVVVQTLRIQTWIQDMPFVYYDDAEIYTGSCRNLGAEPR
jgi:hypothetical protein